MPVFTRKTASNGNVMYRNVTENKPTSAEILEKEFPAVKEELDLADEGTQIDSETVTKGAGDGVTDADGKPLEDRDDSSAVDDAPEEEEAEDEGDDEEDEAYVSPVRSAPSSEVGMGELFKRVNGKTVDIFDGKTPHTAVRLVDGLMVPLSNESYKTKTDAEIFERLQELRGVAFKK